MTIDVEEMISVADTAVPAQEGSDSSLSHRVLQKPLGVGAIVGIVTGLSNSLILGLPLISSIFIGGLRIVSLLIWLPGMMKGQIAARKELEKQRKAARSRRQRIIKHLLLD